MNDLLPFRRDLRVGGLLHAVVQEGVGLWIADCRLRIAGYGLCAADCGSYFQSAIRNPRSAIPRRQDQPLIDRSSEIIRHLFRRLFADDGERLRSEGIPDARCERQYALSFGREPLNVSHHQVNDVVGYARARDFVNAVCPAPLGIIELQETLLLEESSARKRTTG